MGSNSFLIGKAQHMQYFNEIGGELMESRFDPNTFGSDIMLNHYFFQKLKLIEKSKFNYSINTLTRKKKPKLHSRSERTIFYQASSRRAMIPPGFCKK
jgi:hypothetical protein